MMSFKLHFVLVAVLAHFGLLLASPTRRRQLIGITESTVSETPVTSDEVAWADDNDEFDFDDHENDWIGDTVVSPSSMPEKEIDYDDESDDDYPQEKIDGSFGGGDDDDDDDDDDGLEEDESHDSTKDKNQDSKYMFLQSKDSRLMLDNDDDGPIKVRHTGRNSYPRVFEQSDNSAGSSQDEDEDNDKDNEHSYEFTIDEDDKDNDGGDGKDDDDDEDDDEILKDDDDTAEALKQHDEEDDEEDFVSEGEDGDMFDNPEENASHVIYGDHVFLY